MSAKIIRVENLTKIFKTTTALDKLNFELDALTAMIGSDGAGKTTFMWIVASLMSPTSGSLEVLGLNISGNEQAVQPKISCMPQQFGLYEDLSIA